MKKTLDFVSKFKLIPACILIVIFGIIIDSSFLNDFNLNSLFKDVSIIGMLVLGEMLVILTGGIDLSVGNIASAASVFVASMMITLESLPPELNLIISVIYALAFGTLLGTINGVAVTILRLPPMLATLCGMWIAKGMSYFFLKGVATPYVVGSFTQLARFKIGFMPISFVLLLLVALVIYLFLTRRQSGRGVYAVGGNEYSAYLSGIKVRKTKIFVYAASGLLATIGGLILGAYTGTSYVKGASGYEMYAIAAVIIGGFAMTGGTGNVWNVVLGTFFIRALNKILIFLNLSNQMQGIYIGLLLLLALFISTRTKKRRLAACRKPGTNERG